jgi:hypothetical protein
MEATISYFKQLFELQRQIPLVSPHAGIAVLKHSAQLRLMIAASVPSQQRRVHSFHGAKREADRGCGFAKLAANCDNSTTVRAKMQQSVPKVSQIGR